MPHSAQAHPRKYFKLNAARAPPCSLFLLLLSLLHVLGLINPYPTPAAETTTMSTNSQSATGGSQTATGARPLQFKWTLWHDTATRGRGATYAENLRKVASFDTVEGFSGAFCNLMPPSELSAGQTYNLFKDGIEPKWEDPQNMAGGEWRLVFQGPRKSMVDQCWLATVMNVIGEQFSSDQSDDIAGIVVNIKSSFVRLAIWTKTSRNQCLQEALGAQWKHNAGIQSRIEYLVFQDVMNAGRGARARYSL